MLSACSKVADEGDKRTFEVGLFDAAYGLRWYRQMAAQFLTLHPELRINMWGSPRVSNKVRPRILRRDPPELVLADLPIWLLVKGGRLEPLDRWLDQPAHGQDTGRWRDTFLPGVLETNTYNGQVYGLPLYFGGYVVFYNRKMFRDKGWEIPQTWAELEILCQTIKAAGIAPFAFQGKYPIYAQLIYFSLLQRIGGLEAVYAIDDLVPGAFSSAANVATARLLQHLATDYYQPGSMAMNHIEAQAQFLYGKTAMVACGFWLRKEMEDKIPDDFELSCFDWPPIAEDIPYCWHGGGGGAFMVFSDAREKAASVEFLRYMTARENMRDWIGTNSTLVPIKDAAIGLDVPLDLGAALGYMQRASAMYTSRLEARYPVLQQAHVEAIRELITGRLSPEAFCTRMEERAEALRHAPHRDEFPPSQLPESYLAARRMRIRAAGE